VFPSAILTRMSTSSTVTLPEWSQSPMQSAGVVVAPTVGLGVSVIATLGVVVLDGVNVGGGRYVTVAVGLDVATEVRVGVLVGRTLSVGVDVGVSVALILGI